MLGGNRVDHVVEFSYILPQGDDFGRGEELFQFCFNGFLDLRNDGGDIGDIA